MTKDRFPRAGEADGVHFAMGYSGHGAQIATHMGEIVADQILGRARSNPWAALPWPAIPGHLGQPWFLPLVGAYYKLKDRIE
jgi:glycine/D-amino acid oxidase-like deaminating enzyme